MRMISARGVKKASAAAAVVFIVLMIVLILSFALYVMVSGYLSGAGTAPKSLSFASTGFFRNAHVTDINFSVATSSLLTAGQVGFKIVTSGGSTIPPGTDASNTRVGCTVGNPFGGCGFGNGTSGSWYLVITDSSVLVRAVFDTIGWVAGSNLQWSASYTLTVVSATSYIGSGDDLETYGLVGSSVSGTVAL